MNWKTILAAGSILFTGTLYAQTPDGETPANEGVCDGLQGGTPGLYGLCVAYCEAQDFDTIEKQPSSTKILANYRKKMKAGDPDMPCIQVQTQCSCFTNAELANMTADGLGSCNRVISNRITIIDNGSLNYAEVDTSIGNEVCRYADIDTLPDTVRFQSISADDAQSCFATIDQACTDGLSQ